MALNLKELRELPPEVESLQQATADAAKNHANSAAFYRELNKASTWEGHGGEAARAGKEASARDHEAKAEDLRKAAGDLERVHGESEDLAKRIGQIFDEAYAQPAVDINDVTNQVTAPSHTSYLKDEEAARIAKKVSDLQIKVGAVLAAGAALDADLARAIATATGTPVPDLTDGTPTRPGLDPRNAERRRNQSDAFKELFGRAPTTPADWATAAAMDPHSYDPKNKGAPPRIAVAKIEPSPGQGVLQNNFFIPSKDVIAPNPTKWPPRDLNAGDNRGFNPKSLPEDSRVSILVDYENGVIVARQNPSVNMTTGEAQAGIPEVSAVQKSDKSVLIYYNTADPFSVGGQNLAKDSYISVNGNLGIAPGPDGPRVGANMTWFPAFEVNHMTPSGQWTPVLQEWPQIRDDAWGPLTGLAPPTHYIGDGSIPRSFTSIVPANEFPHAVPLPPGTGAHVPPVMPALPPTISIPPALTPLGPPSSAPTIPVIDPFGQK